MRAKTAFSDSVKASAGGQVNFDELFKECKRIGEALERVCPAFHQEKITEITHYFSLLQSNFPCQKKDTTEGPAVSNVCPGHLVHANVASTMQPWVIPCPCAVTRTRECAFHLGPLLAALWKPGLDLSLRNVLGQKFLAWNDVTELGLAQAQMLRFLIKHHLARECTKRTLSTEARARPAQFTCFPEQFVSLLSESQKAAARACDSFLLLQDLCGSQLHGVFQWSSLRKSYLPFALQQDNTQTQTLAQAKILRTELFEKAFVGRTLFVVCLDEKQLQQKSGLNVEAAAFEEFVSDLARTDAGLVVFSAQPLLRAQRETPLNLVFDYTQDHRETYRDENNRLRFASKRASQKPQPTMRDCLRAGAFDRLVALLAQGQAIIDHDAAVLSAAQGFA